METKNQEDYLYPVSKIKDVYIQLKDYKFHHNPYQDDKVGIEDSRRFIGREKVKNRIKILLTNSKTKSGTYLVTGFRGMGKTSLVRQAIDEINNSTKSVWNIFLTICIIVGQWISLILFFNFLIRILFIDETKLLYNSFLSFLNIATNFTYDWIDQTIFKLFLYFILILPISELILLLLFKRKNYLLYIKDVISKIREFLWGFKKKSFILVAFLFAIIHGIFSDFPSDITILEYLTNNLHAKIHSVKINKDLLIRKSFSLAYYIVLATIFLIIISFIFDFLKFIRNELKTKVKYFKFEINLSQESLNERDILGRITEKLINFWEKEEDHLLGFRYQRKFYNPLNLLFNIIGYKNSFKRERYLQILDRLYGLRNRLAAAVSLTRDSDGNPNVYAEFQNGFSKLVLPFSKHNDKNTINYPIANSKEAEDELLHILEMIDTYDSRNRVPDFIFIVDELDKIDPQNHSALDAKEYSNPILDSNLNDPGSRQYRKRQEAVANLLANMKGFLNVAKAKFFFIGGRELFDADMADIADRDSFYSSIFNDVIYVNSFYKDSVSGSNKEGITAMTEAFLMNIIFGQELNFNNRNNYLTLDYLLNWCYKQNDKIKVSIPKSNNGEYLLKKNSFTKSTPEFLFLASLLQNFIIFLVYRSNGSPKKLTALFEHYIVEEKNRNSDFYKKHLLVDMENCNSDLYLRLSYNKQYEINLTSDLVRPYMMFNSRYLKSLGDKLLFSTAFIYDHLLKFHPFGFSWRNIELIPEVILANKEPHLRDHIRSILSFMGNFLVKDTISGLYDYKFHSVIRKELSIMSKTSDLAAAAFNFTLDESLMVKRHYKKKLIELREKYKNYNPIEGDNQFVHSLHFIQVIMGNLYFYDKEYDEAIIYYTEAIQTLRLPNDIDERRITRHQFLLWLTTKLKIGLTLEKLEAYESALSIYRTLMIDSKRYLNKFEKNITPFVNNESDHVSEFKTEIHRTMQSMLLAHVSMLAVLEKNRADGIDYNNLYQTIEEINEIIGIKDACNNKLFDSYRRGFLWSDFYSNVGSILFYKNCQFSRFYTSNLNATTYYETDGYNENLSFDDFKNLYFVKTLNDPNTEALNNDCWKNCMYKFLHGYHRDNNIIKYDSMPSFTSIIFYISAIKHLTDYHENRIRVCAIDRKDVELNPIQVCALFLHAEFVDMINARRFYYLANLVSKLADAIYASLSSKNNYLIETINKIESIQLILDKKNEHNKKLLNLLVEEYTINVSFLSGDFVLKLYYLSAELFKKSGQAYYYSFAMKKMLYLIKDIVYIGQNFRTLSVSGKKFILEYCKNLSVKIVKANTWQNEITNIPFIIKYRDILNINTEIDKNKTSVNKLLYEMANNNGDVREAVIITETIRLRWFKVSSFNLSCFGRANNKYIRMMEMKFRAEQLFYTVSKESDEDIIIEALFCIRECIVIIQLYDPGYIIGYSYLAACHDWAEEWCELFNNIIQEYDSINRSRILSKLKNVVGRNSLSFMDANYHREAAIQNYQKVLQMHTEGEAYKDKVLGLYLLEDDYNDLLTHFQISMERFRVNIGDIRNKISNLQKKVDESRLYKYINYVS